jgi:peroxiredoxin
MGARREPQIIAPGQAAPDFDLDALGGGRRALSEILERGRALLAFFKVSCPVCQFAFPYLERLHQSRSIGDAQVLGISQNDPDETREFMDEFNCTFPALLDPEDRFPASNDYGISYVPTIFLIERDGRVSQSFTGWSKADMEELARRLSTTLFQPGENVPAWKAG